MFKEQLEALTHNFLKIVDDVVFENMLHTIVECGDSSRAIEDIAMSQVKVDWFDRMQDPSVDGLRLNLKRQVDSLKVAFVREYEMQFEKETMDVICVFYVRSKMLSASDTSQ